jgi:ketosteroid isomerase-like protein
VARTPHDIFQAHSEALARADVTELLRDYAQDAVLITPDGPITGRRGIGEFYRGAFAALPQAVFTVSACVFAHDALLIRWSATSTAARIENGVDTFVFADGLIRLQTIVFELQAPTE